MPELTKKRLINVTVGRRRFEIPATEVPSLFHLLKAMEKGEETKGRDDESAPWRAAFKKDIKNSGSEGALILRGARLKADLTQLELAQKADLEQGDLSKMERGHRPIGKDVAKRLAKVLRVDYRIFL